MARKHEARFMIGYNLAWRILFGLLGLFFLVASCAFLLAAAAGEGKNFWLPTSTLVASLFLSLYLLPLVMVPQQEIEVADDGLKLTGENSVAVLPWATIREVRIKRVMLFMPYLVISLSQKDQFADFLDKNPQVFLARWTAHVRVLKRYPVILRWLFSAPKTMTTAAMLDWLEQRYGGSIVIDTAAVNGRGRQLCARIRNYISDA